MASEYWSLTKPAPAKNGGEKDGTRTGICFIRPLHATAMTKSSHFTTPSLVHNNVDLSHRYCFKRPWSRITTNPRPHLTSGMTKTTTPRSKWRKTAAQKVFESKMKLNYTRKHHTGLLQLVVGWVDRGSCIIRESKLWMATRPLFTILLIDRATRLIWELRMWNATHPSHFTTW